MELRDKDVYKRQSECYMSDVPTPFKNELPEYQEQEEHLLGIIYEKFLGSDLTEEEQKELKKIDHAMLWYDLEHLLGEIQYGEIPELHIDLDYTVRPFEEVEEEYLSLFEKFSSIQKKIAWEGIADKMLNILEINDFAAPELDIYARRTEARCV